MHIAVIEAYEQLQMAAAARAGEGARGFDVVVPTRFELAPEHPQYRITPGLHG